MSMSIAIGTDMRTQGNILHRIVLKFILDLSLKYKRLVPLNINGLPLAVFGRCKVNANRDLSLKY
jgi:hypothetical protein